jgi:hypothetical protein
VRRNLVIGVQSSGIIFCDSGSSSELVRSWTARVKPLLRKEQCLERTLPWETEFLPRANAAACAHQAKLKGTQGRKQPEASMHASEGGKPPEVTVSGHRGRRTKAPAAMVALVGLAGVGLVGLLAFGGGEGTQHIEWHTCEGCPSQAAVVEATAAFLGGALAAFPRAVIVSARVEADPAGFRLRLTITVDGQREHHELRAVDCDQLGRNAALLIASAVDPLAWGPPPPVERQLGVTPVVVQRPRALTQPSTAPTPAEPSAVEPSAPPPWVLIPIVGDRPEPLERQAKRPIAGRIGVAGTGLIGLFPQVGGGVELEGGLERGLFRWQLGAAGWFGGSFRAPGGEVGADLWAASGSTGACVVPSWARVRFAACAVAGFGAITVTAINTESSRRLTRPWAFAGPDLRVTWTPRSQLGLYLGIAALPALVRPGWSVQNPDASFRIPPIAGLLRVGVELGPLGDR